MPCSYCKRDGHTKKTCPDKRDAVLKIQRDRINMAMQIAPMILANPIAQGLLWFYISDKIPLLDAFNKIIVGTEVISLIPTVDTNSFPQGVIMGAFLQETKDGSEYYKKITEGVKATKSATEKHGYKTGSSDWIRDLEEGSKYYYKYGEIPPQLLTKYKKWSGYF